MNTTRRSLLASSLLAALVACGESKSPTAPALPDALVSTAATSHLYSGTFQLGSVQGRSSDSRVRCALAALQNLASERFELTLLMDGATLVGATGNWGTELTGASLTCTMDYLQTGGFLEISPHSCDNYVLPDHLAGCIGTASGVKVRIDRIRVPAVDADGNIRGAGELRATATGYSLAPGEWFVSDEVVEALVLPGTFDLRRQN